MFHLLYLNEFIQIKVNFYQFLVNIFTYVIQIVYSLDDLFMPWRSNKEFFQIPPDA